jgi:hypothetical protein
MSEQETEISKESGVNPLTWLNELNRTSVCYNKFRVEGSKNVKCLKM